MSKRGSGGATEPLQTWRRGQWVMPPTDQFVASAAPPGGTDECGFKGDVSDLIALQRAFASEPPDVSKEGEADAKEDLLRRCKAILREQHILKRGRPKKTRDELLVELEAEPLFLAFQDELQRMGKLRASSVVKVLKGASQSVPDELERLAALAPSKWR